MKQGKWLIKLDSRSNVIHYWTKSGYSPRHMMYKCRLAAFDQDLTNPHDGENVSKCKRCLRAMWRDVLGWQLKTN